MATVLILLADGVQYPPPGPSKTEAALGLLGTACAIWLFVRALLRGSGPLGRG